MSFLKHSARGVDAVIRLFKPDDLRPLFRCRRWMNVRKSMVEEHPCRNIAALGSQYGNSNLNKQIWGQKWAVLLMQWDFGIWWFQGLVLENLKFGCVECSLPNFFGPKNFQAKAKTFCAKSVAFPPKSFDFELGYLHQYSAPALKENFQKFRQLSEMRNLNENLMLFIWSQFLIFDRILDFRVCVQEN